MLGLALALVVVATRAQGGVWGTTGAWEQLFPSTTSGSPQPALAYRGATHTMGSLIVTRNDSSGNLGVAMFDVANNRWEDWPSPLLSIADPITFSVGGQVFVCDELNVSALAFVDASAARSDVRSQWQYPTVLSGPTARYGMRMAVWGSLVYFFGGVEVSSGLLHSDLWALSAGVVVTGYSSPFPSWTQLTQDGAAGMPPGRVGYSFTPFGTSIALFGGVSLLPSAPASARVSDCFDPAKAALCDFHSRVHLFSPGNPGPPGEMVIDASQWRTLGSGGAPGGTGPVPSGRFDHIAGAVSDQLYVYGGTTATGASNEMWCFNIVTEVWGLVAPSLPAPDAASLNDAGYGVGAWMGRHFYRYRQAVDGVSGEPLPGSGQLWRWAPAAAGGGAPAPLPPPASAAAAGVTLAPGPSAGLALSVLLGALNGCLLLLLARASGACSEIEGALPAACACSSRRAAGSGAPGGFYSSAALDDAAGRQGAYGPPPA